MIVSPVQLLVNVSGAKSCPAFSKKSTGPRGEIRFSSRKSVQTSEGPDFHLLIMSEESRLGREQIETAYALKQIMDAGVRVFFFLEDRERTLLRKTGTF